MTGVTSIALIYISRNPIVLIQQVRGGVMFVAINAAEGCKVARTGMAFRTIVPFSLVFPAVNGEVHSIMIKSRRYPGRF